MVLGAFIGRFSRSSRDSPFSTSSTVVSTAVPAASATTDATAIRSARRSWPSARRHIPVVCCASRPAPASPSRASPVMASAATSTMPRKIMATWGAGTARSAVSTSTRPSPSSHGQAWRRRGRGPAASASSRKRAAGVTETAFKSGSTVKRAAVAEAKRAAARIAPGCTPIARSIGIRPAGSSSTANGSAVPSAAPSSSPPQQSSSTCSPATRKTSRVVMPTQRKVAMLRRRLCRWASTTMPTPTPPTSSAAIPASER
ncbi:MAG: hypothetical protein R3D25_14900 [Geminicoccaceae bacterium]